MNSQATRTRRRQSSSPAIRLQLSEKLSPLLTRRARYKVFWGGRGGQKSWGAARALIAIAHTGRYTRHDKPRRFLIGCFRELQNSIKDSVHRLLKEQIDVLGLSGYFDITETSIRSRLTGSEFIFKGIKSNTTTGQMKSLEGVDIAWVEEAHLVSEDSWQLLIPTIRKEGSEIWITFNPNEEDDPTYKRFVVRPPPLTEDRKNVTDDFISDDAIVIKVGWQDNLWFPQTLENERLYLLAIDPEAYAHVWDGECRTITDAVIFKGRYQVGCFDPPEVVQFHFGLDFGYADDPMACTRMWVTEHRGIAVGEGKDRKLIETGDGPIRWQELWIDYEAYGHRVEIDAYPDLLDQIPGSRQWPILADSSRPESISYIARKGFRCSAAEKWQGSVEDGIAHLKAFRVIHIHQRCIHHLFEARAYKWKVDKITNDILPIIVDKHNHCWDADRYALSKYIQRRGVLAQWAKLGQ